MVLVELHVPSHGSSISHISWNLQQPLEEFNNSMEPRLQVAAVRTCLVVQFPLKNLVYCVSQDSVDPKSCREQCKVTVAPDALIFVYVVSGQ